MKFGVCIMLFAASTVLAATASGEEPFPYPAGEKQVVVGFSGWRAQVYEGGLGLRFFHSKRWATVAALSVSISSESEAYDRIYTDRYRTYDRSYDAVGLGVSAVMEKYLPTFHNLAPCLGFGFHYRYSWSDRNEVWREDGESGREIMETGVLNIGGRGVLGAEWAFAPGISLGLSYVLILEYERWSDAYSQDTSAYPYSAERTGSRTRLRTEAGLLTVSFRL